VEAAIAAHNVAAAESALHALRGQDAETLAGLKRRISLEKVLLTRNADEARSALAQQLSEPSAERETGVRHLDTLLLEEAKSDVATGRPHRALTTIKQLSVPTPESEALTGAAHKTVVDMCLAGNDHRCARKAARVSGDPALEKRVTESIALEVSTARSALAMAGKSPKQLRQRLERRSLL